MKINRLALCAVFSAALLAVSACQKQDAPAASTGATAAASAASATVQGALPQAGAFIIHGKTEGMEDGRSVMLGMVDPKDPTSTKPLVLGEAKIKGNAFTIEGKVDSPAPAMISIGEHMFIPMIVEKGEFTASISDKSVDVRGGDFHDKLYAYTRDPAYIKAAQDSNRGFEEAFKGVNMEDEKQVAKARAKLELVPMDGDRIRNEYLEKIIRSDAAPMLRLLALSMHEDSERVPDAEREAIYAVVEKEIGPQPLIEARRKTEEMSRQAEKSSEQVAVGKQFIDMAFKDTNGKDVKISEIVGKNKLVLLDFWASWCGPCRAEFPHLRKVYGEFHSKGFEIYAVSADEEDADWRKALKEENVPWINTVEPRGMGAPSLLTYGVMGLPANFLIDHKGTIVGVNMREWDVERAVKAAMQGKPIPQPERLGGKADGS